MTTAESQAPLRLIFDKLVDTPRSSAAIVACGVAIAIFALLAVSGWVVGVPVLVKPSGVFQAMRPMSALAFGAVGVATVLMARRQFAAARVLCMVILVIVGAGAILAVLGIRLPLDPWFTRQAAEMGITQGPIITLPSAIASASYATAILLLSRERVTRGGILAAYALGILLIAAAAVLSIVHVSELHIGAVTRVMLGIGLQAMLAMALSGIALVLLVSRTRAVPTSPPRWVPAFATATMAMLVIVLWLVLRADDENDRARQAKLAADGFARSINAQLDDVERALLRRATLAERFAPSSESGKRGIELLIKDIEGLDQVLWIRKGGVASTLPSEGVVPESIGEFLARRVASLTLDRSDNAFNALIVEPLPSSRWTMAVLAPLQEVDGVSVLAAVLDEQEFLARLTVDSSSGFRAELHAVSPRPPSEHEFDYDIGGRPHRVRVIPVSMPSVRASSLPDVVLVLGLGLCVLVGTVLQLIRTTWTQARIVESARLQAALDNATDGVFEYDFTTGRARRSRSQLRDLGYDPDVFDTAAVRWGDLIHPDDVERVTAAVQRATDATATQVDEVAYRVRAADDSWHTIVDRGRIVERTSEGHAKVMFGISADVTERLRVDEAREQSERRFRVVFESAQQFQALIDSDGTLLEVNAAALTMAGVESNSVVGQHIIDGPWWQDLESSRDRLSQRFAEAVAGDVVSFELETRFAGGRAGILDFAFTPLFDAEGWVTQVLAEGRDVTERRRAEDALREIGALTTMGRLAARVAHEINNPLAGIQNSFLLLADAIPSDHPHHRFVGAIEREIQRIAVVTRQLYETYRPDQSTTAHSSVVLAVTDAVSFLHQVNRGRGVRIMTDVSRAPSSIPVPDALLRQTLYNLVQNAVEASPANGVVTVTAARDGDSCVIVVRDEGAGIAPHLRERIWDPFFSTKDSKVKSSGMGLGLALVRQSVEAVGGQVHLVDSPAGGATFEVRLPMTPITRVAGDRIGAGAA